MAQGIKGTGPEGPCSIKGCDRPASKAGRSSLCNAHYLRLIRIGDVQADKPVRRFGTAPEKCSVPGCDRPVRCKALCGAHYGRLKKHGAIRTAEPVGSKSGNSCPLDERFWLYVDKNGPTPAHRPDLGSCWSWIGSRNHRGYGQINVGAGRRSGAHRVAYELANGPITAGLETDHLCHNPSCVNPTHLEAVTHQENLRRRRPASETS